VEGGRTAPYKLIKIYQTGCPTQPEPKPWFMAATASNTELPGAGLTRCYGVPHCWKCPSHPPANGPSIASGFAWHYFGLNVTVCAELILPRSPARSLRQTHPEHFHGTLQPLTKCHNTVSQTMRGSLRSETTHASSWPTRKDAWNCKPPLGNCATDITESVRPVQYLTGRDVTVVSLHTHTYLRLLTPQLASHW
jgi:hypothetical protein